MGTKQNKDAGLPIPHSCNLHNFLNIYTMAQKKDWGKILDFIKNNPYIKDLAVSGLNKLIDFSKNGLPFRKDVVRQLAEQKAEIEALKVAVSELLEDKMNGDGNN